MVAVPLPERLSKAAGKPSLEMEQRSEPAAISAITLRENRLDGGLWAAGNRDVAGVLDGRVEANPLLT